MSNQKPPYCPIALSIHYVGDKWTLLILRDLILDQKTRFKELKASKGNIATNILTNRLKMLLAEGFVEYLNPSGTKKSRQYIVTEKGLLTLPILFELYSFSIHAVNQAMLNASELAFKKEFLKDATGLKEKKTKAYIDFVQELKKIIA
ncbi:MAG: winged helix-turn-helix transcriptional regulator [Polaribacter sp.]|nr:winged helix-turn-helix transcriptional regulator [Polaribacter sp.]MDG1321530.1 winged helix-turn-helix transcriptional regulator [Polaribacter sp.]